MTESNKTEHTTCTKLYADFPFAHRQSSHEGHCAWIHGHNWSFEITFAAEEFDKCGFVVDFGRLKYVKDFLLQMFDHTLVLADTDPYILSGQAAELERAGLVLLKTVPDPSCEGLARYVFQKVGEAVANMTSDRVRVTKVTVYEDSKNSAAYFE